MAAGRNIILRTRDHVTRAIKCGAYESATHAERAMEATALILWRRQRSTCQRRAVNAISEKSCTTNDHYFKQLRVGIRIPKVSSAEPLFDDDRRRRLALFRSQPFGLPSRM